MKKTFALAVSILLMILLFQSFYSGPETEAKMSQLLSKSNIINLQYPQEKVYLHIDRPSYWGSDNIWFKAYLQNSPLVTCNLYVELLNAKGDVLQKKICWAQNGLSYGDFHLPDTTSTGVYQIRAYTNWMRNFEEDGFFKKNIIIWNLRDKIAPSETTASKDKKIDFQLFPESGTFISSVNNRMAFKVTDQNGKGLDVEGRVMDELGNEVVAFKSGFKGMGSFTIVPQPGKKYRAIAMVDKTISMEVPLPVAQDEGVALSVEKDQNELFHFKITEKQENPASTYMMVGRAAGTVFYKKEVQLSNGTIDLEIPKNTLPPGILQFTIFDDALVPCCERLLFAKMPGVIDIGIYPDKEEYKQRGVILIDLEARDGKKEPCLANLSVSIYHPETQLKLEEYPHTILSQFLLGSELKGVIEEPGWYFKDQSPAIMAALDNLMLTHGWRHFAWKQIKEDKIPEINYPAEESLQLRGRVKSIVRGNPVPKAAVTMMTVNKLMSVKNQETDSLGRFVFPELFFNDTIEVSIQAINRKGKKNTVIELDKRSYISPKANYLPSEWFYTMESNSPTTTSNINPVSMETIKRKWHLSDTILLGDVQIKAEKVKKNDGHVRMYLTPDYAMDVAKQDNVYSNIIEMMDGRISGIRYDSEKKAFYVRGSSRPATLLMDGVPINFDMIESISISSFDKVEVLKYAPMLGSKGNDGAIFFYMNRGVPQKFISQDALGMKSTKIAGYSVIREFYSPHYKPDEVPKTRTDFRNTLYWNPVVKTDSTGMATVGYFNSDQTGEVQVVVEGVTTDGQLCRGIGKYMVKE